MNQFDNHTKPRSLHPSSAPTKLGHLLDLLLADAMTDIEAVARELGLRDEMRERLRRSLDRLACAQAVAEALSGGIARNAPDDSSCDEVNLMESILRAMITLATSWPQNYGADAVEWLVLEERPLMNREAPSFRHPCRLTPRDEPSKNFVTRPHPCEN
jgi:hypothetical protein